VARKNLARKIAAICLAVMKKGKPYEEKVSIDKAIMN